MRRELCNIENMRLPKEILLRNPFVQFGITKGRHQGEVELVLRQLTHRLGPVSARQRQAIRKLPIAKVEALGKALLDFQNRSDLSRWLKSQAK